MTEADTDAAQTVKITSQHDWNDPSKHDYLMYTGAVEDFLQRLPDGPIFDLIVTSPPYNIGKSYERRLNFEEYMQWQKGIIAELVMRLKPNGSLCWQIGNYVENGEILPLDIEFDPIFRKTHKLKLRNRIVWHYRHGLHAKSRFSGRYEMVLWYTKATPHYTFNLDDVRIRARYPSKRHFKGSRVGELSGNPLGKNPEDVWEVFEEEVWDIPNVKGNHVEKTEHPCQFPVGLVERLVKALTNPQDLVFDPFAGVGSAGVAAALHQRRFWGCDIVQEYVETGAQRIEDALAGRASYRPHDKPLYDPETSPLSQVPEEWKKST